MKSKYPNSIKTICGIDASLSSTGVCIMDYETGGVLSLFKICTPEDYPLLDRVHMISSKIREMCYLYDVDFAIIEDQHLGLNAGTLKLLSNLAGGITTLLMSINVYSNTYQPKNIRKYINVPQGGSAKKDDVYNYIIELYGDNSIFGTFGPFNDNNNDPRKNSDIFDAAGICISFRNMK